MPIPVSVHKVAEEMSMVNDQISAYINRTTGEIVMMEDDYFATAEKGYDPEDHADWEVETLEMAKEIADSEDFLELPTQFDIHDYSIMQKFCWFIKDEHISTDLERAISRSGAFRRFRS